MRRRSKARAIMNAAANTIAYNKNIAGTLPAATQTATAQTLPRTANEAIHANAATTAVIANIQRNVKRGINIARFSHNQDKMQATKENAPMPMSALPTMSHDQHSTSTGGAFRRLHSRAPVRAAASAPLRLRSETNSNYE